MRQFLKMVTVTGADDSTDINWMARLSEKAPFVEWGILLSASSMGSARFPTKTWMQRLQKVKDRNPNMMLSAHLCGRWVRDFCLGKITIDQEVLEIMPMFSRLQLNFHAFAHDVRLPDLIKAVYSLPVPQVILQLDGVNDDLLVKAREAGLNAVGLFDLSGGNGILPEQWPFREHFAGYAGGLSAENIIEQILKIEQVCKNDAWIDAETRLRTTDDKELVQASVESFLKNSKPWVMDQ